MIRVSVEYSKNIFSEKKPFLKKVSLIGAFIKLNIIYTLKKLKRGLRKTKKYVIVNSISELNNEVKTVYTLTDRNNRIDKPEIFNEVSRKFMSISGKSPDLNIYKINDSFVVAKTSSVFSNDKVFNQNLLASSPKYDFKNPLVQNIDSYINKNVRFYLKSTVIDKSDFVYIHLLNEHSDNYYHWLFEIMPKFIQICEVIKKNQELKNEKYILLVDEKLPNQFYEILEVYSTINFKVKIINAFTAIYVNKMIYCTDFWLSIDNTKFIPDIKKEFFVDRYAVSLLKDKIRNYLIDKKPRRKIYVKRHENQARYLKNNSIVEEILIKDGFEVIRPEELTFLEQVKLFNEAIIVIGSSGAVFSNIIFMQKNTYAIIFSPNTIASNYYIFQQMADVSGVKLIHLLTDNSSYLDSVHASSSLNIEALQSLLKDIQ